MDRRKFTRSSIILAGAASAIPVASFAQTPEGTASPAASTPVVTDGVWEGAENPVTIEYDQELFGPARSSGVTGEWCVLRIPDIDRFLAMIIKFEDKYPHQFEGAKDLLNSEEELNFDGRDAEITNVNFYEENGAIGRLDQVNLPEADDTWSYTQFIPSEDPAKRTSQVWITSRISKFDRELMEAAVGSVMIDGEPAIRALDVATLFDDVEALEAPE